MPNSVNREGTEMTTVSGRAPPSWWQATNTGTETRPSSEPSVFVEPTAENNERQTGNNTSNRNNNSGPTAVVNNSSLHRNDTLPIPEPLIIIPDNLSVTGPMVDLPPIRPPELKIIGRSVSFVADCVEKGELRDYYYQGMVAQITRDTVTMLEVLKFTVEGYAAYKAKQQNPVQTTTANDSNNQSRIVTVGTPLPRRARRGRNTGSTAQTRAGESNSYAVLGASAVSGVGGNDSVSIAPSFFSPEVGAGGFSGTAPPPSRMSPPHPTDGPNSTTVAANNFSIDASVVGGEVGQTRLYDYNAYNRQNHYNNSSTLMPDAGPRAPVGNTEANAAVRPYTASNDNGPCRNGVGGAAAVAGTTLDSLLPIIEVPVAICEKAPAWQKDQPLAHFKFMTFARRKIRKVEFSTDHPMAGLLEPFYVSRYFKPHWEPSNNTVTSNNGPDGAGEVTAQNDANNNNDPYGTEPAPAANEPTANLPPQEIARRAKEKAKKKWQAQQASDTPVLLEIPLSHSKNIVGKERNTAHPFMGVNLRVIDPEGYRARKAVYKRELREFFDKNERAKELLSHVTLPRISQEQALAAEDANNNKVRTDDTTLENELGNPNVDPSPFGGNCDESSRIPLASTSSTTGAESSSSDDDDDDNGDGAHSGEVGSSENQVDSIPRPKDGMDSSLASASKAQGLKKYSKPKVSTVSILGGGDDDDPLKDRWHGGLSLKLVDPLTLEKLIAEGAPQRPSAYEYPSSLSDLYDDPKWLKGNPYILQDLERVRMFVRRFLVHTSQGNNQRQIPLVVFITQRCPWPNPTENMIREILYEELTSLVKIEGELVAKASNSRGAPSNPPNHPNVIGEAGEEVSPGRLLLAETGVIARTTYLAISHIAVSIGLLLYSASAFSSLEKYFVAAYASNLAAWVVAAAATHLFLGAASGFHALKMKAPVDLCHASPRLLMEAVSFTLMLLSLIQLIVLMGGKRNLFKNISEEEEWIRLVRSENEDSCNFMIKNSCSGYSRLCSDSPSQCLSTCLGYALSYTETCEASVGSAVRNSLLPILCIVAICFAFICIDIAYNLRYVRVATRLARALS